MPGDERETLLLVEDDVFVRMHAAEVLEEAGYRVIEAANADMAFSVIQADPHAIHVLVTDVNMPGSMDGCDLAREVDRNWPWIRLVVTSGHAHFSDADIPDHGRFVPKPWVADAVLRAIDGAGRQAAQVGQGGGRAGSSS